MLNVWGGHIIIIYTLPLKPINWLSQLSYTEFVERCLNKDKKHTKEECKTKYSILQQFYSYSTGTSGRLFSGGSLQGLPSTIRGLFMRDGVFKMLHKFIYVNIHIGIWFFLKAYILCHMILFYTCCLAHNYILYPYLKVAYYIH